MNRLLKVMHISQYLEKNPDLAKSLLYGYSQKAQEWLKSRGYEVDIDGNVLPFERKRKRNGNRFVNLLLSLGDIDGDYAGNPIRGSIGCGYIGDFIQRLKLPREQMVIFVTDVPVFSSGNTTQYLREYENKVWLAISDTDFMLEDEEFLDNLKHLIKS